MPFPPKIIFSFNLMMKAQYATATKKLVALIFCPA